MAKEKEIDMSRKQQQVYEKSLSSIIKKVEESKHKAITTVNKLLIELYWYIGESITELQERSKWGDGVVEKLSQDLRMKYPNQSGFSVRNLWNMKRFYRTYRIYEKLQALPAEISWTNNVIILDKTKTIEEKEFYLKMCLKERWSSRELLRQIDSAYYERFMLSQKPEKLMEIEQSKLPVLAQDIHKHLRDDYVLEFLDLSETFSEKELRKAYKPIKISSFTTKLPDKKLIQRRLEMIKIPEKFLIQKDSGKKES